MAEDAGRGTSGREQSEGGDGGVEHEVGGEGSARAISSLTANDVDLPTCRGSGVAHPALGFACPIVWEGEKRWCGVIGHIQQLSRVRIVEEDNAGSWARVAAKDEASGGVERGKGVPCEGGALG